MGETVFFVGGDGRERAIARALAPDCDLYACASNRNPGIAALTEGFETISGTAAEDIAAYAGSVDATLAIVGPESGLAAGAADALDEVGIYTFGPQAAEARIETDKAFQRQFMRDEEIPGNPDFVTLDDTEAACDYIDGYDGDLAVKPAGLTDGKGVKIIGDQVTSAEAKAYLRDSGYERVVLEERLVGEEFTIQAFVADDEFHVSPAVQDHKRAYEGDEGPNTGGVGSYTDVSPSLPFMADDDYETAVEAIEAVMEALSEYKGILYGQFMFTTEGPKVIEFNACFDDPEAMGTLLALETPFIDVFTAARKGESLPELDFTEAATVCKYAIPEGYPTDPGTGVEITAEVDEDAGALLFYASVDDHENGPYTTTSRSFAVVDVADSIIETEELTEDALVDAGEGFHIRHGIGTAALVQRRIDHMAELRGE